MTTMARFSPEEIDRIAALAQLRLTDEARTRLGADLEQILDYVDRLQAVPTDGVPLTAHIVEGAGDLRADEPRPSLDVRDALANATDANEKAGLFRVPRVIGA
ncbi:Glutamyl-tRNA(Gln) amidotransferase subunit C [Luteitalea pratensis]|jgi:aspartyl-tRNA(Asn)/glutamyl-tRNA(Gln) amidotransferase subunit C|uniref:Aspartyl/glutamyl-tRNA(Asn/Gln) amidotransferase subunit C n=2 Tax=Luteitalea pratensis TaxID=1855912 RepID=A0A143PNH3_LUTPR|nr:Glutamyl-tRNA(Gln) amidotransferase subunit C [Luteitalea pratensis]